MLLKFTSSKFSQHDIMDLYNIFGIQEYYISPYVKVTVHYTKHIFWGGGEIVLNIDTIKFLDYIGLLYFEEGSQNQILESLNNYD